MELERADKERAFELHKFKVESEAKTAADVERVIYLSVCLSVCLSVYLSIYLSICLSIYLYVYLSICLKSRD